MAEVSFEDFYQVPDLKFDISPLIQISENEFSKVFFAELFNSLTVKMYLLSF